jgi:hypothetical protein
MQCVTTAEPDPGGHEVLGLGLRPQDRWERGFHRSVLCRWRPLRRADHLFKESCRV